MLNNRNQNNIIEMDFKVQVCQKEVLAYFRLYSDYGSIPGRDRRFSLIHIMQIGYKADTAPYLISIGEPFSNVNAIEA